jgi:hypothetical protein
MEKKEEEEVNDGRCVIIEGKHENVTFMRILTRTQKVGLVLKK